MSKLVDLLDRAAIALAIALITLGAIAGSLALLAYLLGMAVDLVRAVGFAAAALSTGGGTLALVSMILSVRLCFGEYGRVVDSGQKS